MDTPNFFGDAAASLDDSAMVGDSSFDMDPSSTVVPMSQYGVNAGAFVPDAPAQTWGPPIHMGAPLSYVDEDIKPFSRRRAATTTKPTLHNSSVNMSPSLTGSKSSRASSDGSARTRKSLSSQSTAPDEPEPEPAKTKSKTTTKNKKSKKSTQEPTPEPTEEPAEDGKRSKFLERNRVAASKCRQRKKQWMSGLQDTKNELETQHRQLQLEHSSLVNEVSSLKNQLMSHANCDDPNINLWINNEARRFVQSEAGRVSISQVMQGHVGPGAPQIAMPPSFDGKYLS
jgi:bZIP transcription factor